MGRPTGYINKYDQMAYRHCLLGATDKNLAELFEVCEATINTWKIEHPSFLESIKKGRVDSDELVAERLFKRATGYSHQDVHISNYQGEITVTEIIKHYPPDTTAAIFWLKNRRKDKWRDQQHNVVTGPNDGPVEFTEIERAKRLDAILDAARARRDRQDSEGD
jgi:hypothetical protein